MGASIKLTHDFNKFLRVHFDVRSTLRNDLVLLSVNPRIMLLMQIHTNVCMMKMEIMLMTVVLIQPKVQSKMVTCMILIF